MQRAGAPGNAQATRRGRESEIAAGPGSGGSAA